MNEQWVDASLALAIVVVARGLRPRASRRPVRHEAIAPPPRAASARARRRTVEAGYADAVELVVLAVRAGHLPAAALRAVQPHLPAALADGFGAVLQRVDAGHRFADALDELPRSLGSVAVSLAQSLAAADRDGLPLAPVLERLAFAARMLRRRRADTLARQLPVRLSLPLVLCTLPSFVLLAVVPLLLAALSSLRR